METFMFEQPEEKANKDHSRLIMTVSGFLLVVFVALTIIVGTRASKHPAPPLEMARPGSAEFDSYKQSIKMDEIKKATAKNMFGNIGMLSAHVQNAGDSLITGLQLRAVALGFNNEILKEKTITPIPKSRESLGPHETMFIEIQLEKIPEPGDIMEMTIELVGFKLKE